MKIAFKKLSPHAVTPTKAHSTDAGYDLTAISGALSNNEAWWECRTGLAVAIPPGYVGLIFPRSSIRKTCHALRNSVGVIDAGYTGEIVFSFSLNNWGDTYNAGDRVGQLVIIPIPEVELVEVTDLPETDRGNKGFGSSGR